MKRWCNFMDFIIKKPTSSNRTIRMPDTLIDKITRLAAERDISFNQVVVQCCEYAIQNLPKNEKQLLCQIRVIFILPFFEVYRTKLIYRIVIIYLGIKINYPFCSSNCIILLCLSTISLMFYSETVIFLVMLCGKQILVVCNVFHYTWQVTLYFSHNAIWVFAMVSKQSFSVFIIVLSRLFGYSKPN